MVEQGFRALKMNMGDKPAKVEDGYITISDEPGLGLELDDEIIRKHEMK